MKRERFKELKRCCPAREIGYGRRWGGQVCPLIKEECGFSNCPFVYWAHHLTPREASK